MFKVISLLLLYIQIQQKVIVYLMGSVLGKHVMRHVYDEPVDRPYRKLQVDQMPIIEVLEKLDYRKLLAEYQMTHGKELKPVRRHKNTVVKVPESLTCGRCSAPSTYLYANNGVKGQFLCKVCDFLFNKQQAYPNGAIQGKTE